MCIALPLVRRPPFRRLLRHADACLRADLLGLGVPMGSAHRRVQWRDRRLAARAVRQGLGLFPAHVGAGSDQCAAAAAVSVCTLRLQHARGPRLRSARRIHRHRCETGALARLRHRRRCLRRGRRAVCLCQRVDFTRNDRRWALDRRTGHGAARRHPDSHRPDRRRIRVCHVAGYGNAANGILARVAGAHHSAAGAGLPAGNRRRFSIDLAQSGGETMIVLSVRSLSKAFGGVRAVNDVSFDIAQGEFLAMIGPNGAGKSTCFNIINGQLKPDSGKILFEGKDIAGLEPRVVWRLGVGRTFQVAATFASMTVIENVQMALISHSRETYQLWPAAADLHRDRALDLLAQVGMREAADRPSRELAYGDIKRIEFAIALANEPRLLLMHEPTAGMAPRERNELIALVKRLVVERGISVLFTEHSMDVVFAFADRVIVLARGRLIADGDAAAIRDNAQVREVYFGTGKTFAEAVR